LEQWLRLVLLAVLWTVYCTVHSTMISASVTTYLARRWSALLRFYRLLFNAVAVVTLIPIVLYARSLSGAPLWRWVGVGLWVRYALLAGGVLLLIAGARHYSLRQFVGLAQLRGAPAKGLAADGGIDSTGVLALIRHPWYVAVVLIIWARDLDAARLVTNGVLTLYVCVGSVLEERKLLRELGPAYAAYQARVSMFVPVKWLESHVAGRSR
jgi:protein-S-isoprenylcysteine O-methyltransferase Ste14